LSKKGNIYCGTLVKYEEGRHQHLFVKPNKKGPAGSTESAEVSDSNEGWEREVVESALYFAVMDNHLAIIQSVSLKHHDLGNHFSWLLSNFSADFPEGTSFYLKKELTRSVQETFEKEPITNIILSDKIKAFAYGEDEEHTQKLSSHILNPNFFANLKNSDPSIAEIFNSESMDDIRCELIIKIAKKKAEEAGALVRKMAETLGDENFEKTQFKLKSGNIIEGDQMLVKKPISILHYDGVISKQDAYNSLAIWLKDLIESDQVSVT
jgi:hypothetical protein